MSFPSADTLITKIDQILEANHYGCGQCAQQCASAVSNCQCLKSCSTFGSSTFNYGKCNKHRFLYLCKYLIPHKFDIFQALTTNNTQIQTHLGDISSLSCLSFGGGPGTDYAGLLHWIHLNCPQTTNLTYTNYDQSVIAWSSQINVVRSHYEQSIRCRPATITFNKENNLANLPQAQIIICSYVINELLRNNGLINLPATNPGVIVFNDLKTKKTERSFDHIYQQFSRSRSVIRIGRRAFTKLHCGEAHPLQPKYCGQVSTSSLQEVWLVK